MYVKRKQEGGSASLRPHFRLEYALRLQLTIEMRLHILGDLHLEFGETRVPTTDADVVVLAGDIHVGREGRKWIRNCFPETPCVYVLGNHEFYRNSFPELSETLKRETDGSNVHVLENSSAETNGFTFLGCTLWTDFLVAADSEAAMRVAEGMMSDYSIIRNNDENRVLRARDTMRVHQESVVWLRDRLARCEPARTVVVTHHAPSLRSEPPFHVDSPLKAAFVSNLDSLVEQSRVPLWIHGHTHYNVDYKIGSTRVLTNQRGYPDQLCKRFDPGLVIEV
jgi:predicted phosphodiesterase